MEFLSFHFARTRSVGIAAAAAVIAGAVVAPLWADDAEARALMTEAVLAGGDGQIELIAKLAATGSELVPVVLGAWRGGSVYIEESADGSKIPFYRAADGKAIRIDTGEPLAGASATVPVDTTSRLRRAMKNTLDLLAIAAPDPKVRAAAVTKLGMTQNAAYLPALESRLAVEKDAAVSRALREAIAFIRAGGAEKPAKIAAINELASAHVLASTDFLKKLSKDSDRDVAAAAAAGLVKLDGYRKTVEFFGTIFRGLSLGSVLLVVALGLAITFGLMGVINMAHGEIMVVGAYTTYAVQCLFGAGLFLPFFGAGITVPGFKFGGAAYESYFVFAIIAAFFASALVGLALERSVIRFLYSRPLESLLATWGVSLVLQQLFRSIFGSNNVQVSSPAWLSGHFTVSDVLLGWNRLFVIGFAAAIVVLTYLMLTRTPLGLLIRAVMQNRDMAACMGVRTERVNMLTFAFGSGLAGLAGAFLSQLGNVGPSLGQSYIVDCFMTVVVGGVGNLVGTICSALGIGIADQALQPFVGPVMGKITVLAAIILLLQWKPGGLFPTRSRSLEG